MHTVCVGLGVGCSGRIPTSGQPWHGVEAAGMSGIPAPDVSGSGNFFAGQPSLSGRLCEDGFCVLLPRVGPSTLGGMPGFSSNMLETYHASCDRTLRCATPPASAGLSNTCRPLQARVTLINEMPMLPVGRPSLLVRSDGHSPTGNEQSSSCRLSAASRICAAKLPTTTTHCLRSAVPKRQPSVGGRR